jgi:hypothetical protein
VYEVSTRIHDPVTLDEVEKRIHQIGAPPAPDRLVSEHLGRAIEGKCAFVRSLGHERVEHVNDTDNAGEQRDRVAAQSVRVAASVQALMMMTNNRTHPSERAERAAQPVPDHRVLLDQRALVGREGASFLQHRARDANFPDVVEIAASVQRRDVFLTEPDVPAERGRISREALAMVGRSRITGLYGQREPDDH